MDGWHEVPVPDSPIHVYYQRLVPHEGKAYLFQGDKKIHVLDLETETWSTVMTKMKAGQRWPYQKNRCIRYVAEIHDGIIYVFGGADDMSALGWDIFTSLDLKTLEWSLISGSDRVVGTKDLPSLREHAASWMVDGKMYVALGCVNRSGALVDRKPFGSKYDFSHGDLWSYDTRLKKWTDEKILGNGPSARCEIAYCYNKKWDSAIIFGGYCADLPCFDIPARLSFEYSYFADTFMWSNKTSRWTNVVTRGFPTYRALAELVTDEETGKTYLFGGCKLLQLKFYA